MGRVSSRGPAVVTPGLEVFLLCVDGGSSEVVGKVVYREAKDEARIKCDIPGEACNTSINAADHILAPIILEIGVRNNANAWSLGQNLACRRWFGWLDSGIEVGFGMHMRRERRHPRRRTACASPWRPSLWMEVVGETTRWSCLEVATDPTLHERGPVDCLRMQARSETLWSGSDSVSSSESSGSCDSADSLTVPVVLGAIGRLHVVRSPRSLPGWTAFQEILAAERKRQDATLKLILTEVDYLFYSSLMDALGEDLTSVMFPDIEDILLTNTALLSTLEERQREFRLYVDRVGNLLETRTRQCECICSCIDQANAGKGLQSLRNTNRELSAQLQYLWEDPQPGISTHLVTFWYQCLTRRLELPLPIHHLAPRKLLKEGTPMKTKCERMLRVLWNDIPLLLNESGCGGFYSMASPPFHNHPVPYQPDMAPSCSSFTNSKSIPHATTRSKDAHIRRAYPRCIETLALRASNVNEAHAWTEAIAQAVAKAREGIVVVVGDS
ncbi:hypothetical protein BKA82DRAFT_31057, partial [Pisolithus tinctorius]